ncbi:type II toxin-antitoxin system prevent-host-death family antitoxin [Calidifontibacter sp. DB0510]|uniref:Type II toxin-antitoxin system prevent-host-death family antitoxin n=1 Tax=Metallococcus carri TaxID=1656884 RepID=A0A967B990_9MICO|nr:type II toxin-antitoxin system prevent-host-death family antitoxin [Metallococcus carri]NHN57176.1 type II toxin-antitoxin system prevent-host-death family antitoxin [Metallococcus carri]NOP38021.1 type II toxin-antitoxin system prevent-host-death family antitoxin [Calidifontibacter sp. DB2511S]
MPTIASRDLRNHTASVLERVSRGETFTVTVHGRPVAELRRVASQRRPAVPLADLLALLDRQQPDATLAEDMAWIADGTTDDLG